MSRPPAQEPTMWRGASLPAMAGFLVFFGLSAVFGEVWPLSRFPMYADQKRESWVPLVRVDGDYVPIEDLVDIHGCGPGDVRIPAGRPFRTGWRIDGMKVWIAGHGSNAPGPVTFEIGAAPIAVPPEGPRVAEPFETVCRGTARWR